MILASWLLGESLEESILYYIYRQFEYVGQNILYLDL